MSIFNRKTKEETPSETETHILEQLKEQQEFNQLLMKTITDQNHEIKQLKQDNQDILKHLNNEFEIIANDITKVKQSLFTELSKESNNITRRVKIESTKVSDLIKTMDTVTLTDAEIRKAARIGYNYLVKEHGLKKSEDEPYKSPFKDSPIKAVLVDDTPENLPRVKPGKHLMNIPSSQRKKYSLTLLPDGRFKNKDNHGTPTKFTIEDIIQIKEKIPYYYVNDYDYTRISKEYPSLSPGTIKRVIWNIEEGTFNKILHNYNQRKELPEQDLAFTIHESCKKLYTLTGVKGIDIYRKGQGNPKLNFNILDVLHIKNSLPRWIYSQLPRQACAKETGLSAMQLMRVIYNIQQGVFDEYLEKFEDPSKEHKFTIIDNRLYIDSNDTGLDIPTARRILHDYTNAHDKYTCMKSILKTYYHIDTRYLVIITRYYDDPEFRELIIHTEKDTLTLINNPEKRREYGTNIIGR